MKAEGVGVAAVVSAEVVGVVFVEVDLAIVVLIVEAVDLSAVENKDAVVVDVNADGLVEAGGEASPGDVFEIVVNSVHFPDIAEEGAYEGVAIFKEGDAANLHHDLVGIVVGDGEGIDEVSGAFAFLPEGAG